MAFTHPTTGEWMEFDSELPDDLQEVLAKWDRYLVGRELQIEDESIEEDS